MYEIARFARNVEWDFFCNFQTFWRPWLKSNFEAWCKTSLFSKTTSADSVEKLVNYHIKATHPQGPNSSYHVVLPERLILLEYTTFNKNHVRYLLLLEAIVGQIESDPEKYQYHLEKRFNVTCPSYSFRKVEKGLKQEWVMYFSQLFVI